MLLIMELCSGGELSDILNKRKEPFTEAETKIVIERLASALTYLHKNGDKFV
jgi:serine/threonine protein kinase